MEQIGTLGSDEEQIDTIASDLNAQYIKLESKYSTTSDVAALKKALHCITQAVERTSTVPSLARSTSRAVYLTNLSRCQRFMFTTTGDEVHLDEATQSARLAIQAALDGSWVLPALHVSLSDALSTSFTSRGASRRQDMYEALDQARIAAAIPTNHDEHSRVARSALASRLAQYFEYIDQDEKYLEEAISIRKDLLQTTPTDATLYGAILFDLAADLHDLFKRYGNVEDVLSAKQYSARALDAFPPGHRNHVKAVVGHAGVMYSIVEMSRDIIELDRVIASLTTVETQPHNKEDIARLYFQKSRLYESRYSFASHMDDLNRSILAVEAALEHVPPESSLRSVVLQHRSALLSRRAEQRNSLEDMEAALMDTFQALDLASGTSAQESGALINLANRFATKFDLFGGMENLQKSLEYRRQALTVLPENHKDRPARMHALANSLKSNFEHTGSMADLDESIELDRQATNFLNKTATHRSQILNGLSNSLAIRFRQTGNSHDLEEAVRASEAAVNDTPSGHTERPAYLNGLSNRLLTKFERSRNKSHLDKAVVAIEEAVSASKGNVSDQYLYLNTLSNCLFGRFRAYSDVADIDRSIEIARKCLQQPESSPSWMVSCHNLGVRLQWKYQISEDPDEKRRLIVEALEMAEKCVARTPENHPSMPEYLKQLSTRQLFFGMTMDGHPDEEIIAQLMLSASTAEEAFDQVYDTPLGRIDNGNTAGYLYMAGKDWVKASRVLSKALKLFRRVSPMSLKDHDRQLQLRGLSGTASLACACFIALGEPEKALEMLEAGRGIMANIAMGYHADLSDIREADASLHARYVELRNKISQPLPEFEGQSSHGVDVVAVRNAEVAEFEKLEEQIRQLEGLENFNQSMSATQMKQQAAFGPLVAFCTVDQRCDALIVTKDSIESIPLPGLDNAELKAKVPLVVGEARLSRSPPSKRGVSNKKQRALHQWLWDVAVQPVLKHLELLSDQVQPPERKQRIWWITSGPMGLLPLHSAGLGGKKPAQNVYSQVLSSYIPSISSLAFARQCQAQVDTDSPAMTFIQMPQTPGGLTALNTEPEAQAIRDAFAQHPTAALKEYCQPSATEVFEHLRSTDFDMLHLACHAEPDLDDPSRTALLLGSDPSAPEPDALPVGHLRRLHTAQQGSRRPLRLAYLSACCTAQQYDMRLIDENIHLASAFQLCGFPAVIGTLWEADDAAAVIVAKAFYEELFRLDGECRETAVQWQSGYHVARALDYAIGMYRQQKFGRVSAAADVLVWAGFVHIGA